MVLGAAVMLDKLYLSGGNAYLESNVSDLSQYCIEKVVEVCAAQINIGNIIMHIQMS